MFYPFDEPVTLSLTCRNCGDPLVATGRVIIAGMVLRGIQEYRWTHHHGAQQCRPTTAAQPADGWRAAAAVASVLGAREAAAEAMEAALAGEG